MKLVSAPKLSKGRLAVDPAGTKRPIRPSNVSKRKWETETGKSNLD